MFGRRSSTTTERANTESSIEASPRTRRRTQTPDQPDQGRRLFERLQRNRQGTTGREGRHEPNPQVTGGAPYSSEPLPSERGASRRKRIGWGVGALTALGGAGAFYLGRRRMLRRRDLRHVRR